MSTRPTVDRLPALALCSLALSGCMNMSGLSGGTSYGCKAPAGVTCDSVSGTYANAIQNRLPSQRPRGTADGTTPIVLTEPQPTVDAPSPVPRVPAAAPALTTPLRSSARILRLWFKPWEDADHDLYDQGYVYVQIDSGQWLIEHAQRLIRDAYAPLRPPPRSAAASAESKEPPTPASPRPPMGPPRLPAIEGSLKGWAPPAIKPGNSD